MAPLILLILLLAYSDFLYTRFMVFGLLERKYGTGIELNPMISWLVKHTGRDIGALLGIGLPTLMLILVGIDFRPLLELTLLARLLLFFAQANRLRTECLFQKPIKHS